ncbi:TonB family protein [Massilia aurea]|uniref:TonB family protein n=1 Tax=Massilia aurea TaxID=373040 RepID=UPI00346300B7
MQFTRLVFLAAAAIHASQAIAAAGPSAQAVLRFDLYACERPAWPKAALAERTSRTSTLEVRIGESGLVIDGRITASSGRPDLDAAALAAMRNCPFPAVLATGEAPTGWLRTQYRWVPGSAAVPPDGPTLASIRAGADAGDPAAQNLLGSWYQHGAHVKADPAQAAIWYERAALSGNAYAQNNLGVLYFRGAGVPRDARQAAYWYEKAAEQGHGWGQANLAWAYEHTLGNDINPVTALYWLTKAADGGLADAQVRLGTRAMHDAGDDTERAGAAAWLARAAAQDDPSGLYLLGRSVELGLGNQQDDAQAAALYRRALGRTEGRAETALGMLIEAGRTPALGHEDAARLYEQGMSARHAAAFYRYGLLLEQRGDIALAGALYKLGGWRGSCDAIRKYVELRPVALANDPIDSHPPHWVERGRQCTAKAAADLPPQL